MGRFSEAKQANDKAQKYAEEKSVMKSIEERAQRIEMKLKEAAKK